MTKSASGHFVQEKDLSTGPSVIFDLCPRLVPSTTGDPALLKTGFFREVMELKIQRKKPGSDLRKVKHLQTQAFCFFEMPELDFDLFTVIPDGYPAGTCGVSQ